MTIPEVARHSPLQSNCIIQGEPLLQSDSRSLPKAIRIFCIALSDAVKRSHLRFQKFSLSKCFYDFHNRKVKKKKKKSLTSNFHFKADTAAATRTQPLHHNHTGTQVSRNINGASRASSALRTRHQRGQQRILLHRHTAGAQLLRHRH